MTFKKHGISKRNPSANENWQTPHEILSGLEKMGGVYFDPTTTKENPVGAQCIRTPDCVPDGLDTNWNEFGELTFVNPPYRALWYAKLHRELVRRRASSEIVALLPAKPGTAWFQKLIVHADAVIFVRGRLTFEGAPDPAPFESALIYAGDREKRFLRSFSDLGWKLSL